MAKRRSASRWIAAASIAVALSVLPPPPTLLADGGDPSLIHACVKKDNGQVRIVEPSDGCLPSEVSMHWAAGAPAEAGGSIMVHGSTFGAGGAAVIPDTVAIVDGDRVSVVLDRGASTSGSLEVSVAYEIR